MFRQSCPGIQSSIRQCGDIVDCSTELMLGNISAFGLIAMSRPTRSSKPAELVRRVIRVSRRQPRIDTVIDGAGEAVIRSVTAMAVSAFIAGEAVVDRAAGGAEAVKFIGVPVFILRRTVVDGTA